LQLGFSAAFVFALVLDIGAFVPATAEHQEQHSLADLAGYAALHA
jgi:hypothetical protein